MNSDFVSRFEKFVEKFNEISNSRVTSESLKSSIKVTQKKLSSTKHEISRKILSKTYFSVSISSNHLIKLDIFNRIRIFLFRDHLVCLKQTYTRNNDQSISKNQSVEINVEKVENIKNLATTNLEKKVARDSSSFAFFEELKIQKSVKFFLSHTFKLSRELRFLFIEFVDNSSFFVVSAWSEISFWAFDNFIKNIFDFQEDFITVVERFITLTNSLDNDSLNKNRIVEFITTSFSNDINYQNSTAENEKNIENMSLVKNSLEFNADNEINEENQFASKSILFQMNIQEIAMFMFQLFIQNIQNQKSQIQIASFTSRSNFRIIDTNFFDSTLNIQFDTKDVMQIERDIYYKDVFLFVKRIKDVVTILSENVIRINLFTCLREIAQMWYTKEFNDLKKKVLRFLKNDTNRWCETLIKKFKQFVSSTFSNFISKRYILDDVRNKRNISSFVFQIMKHIKIVNIEDLHKQLI